MQIDANMEAVSKKLNPLDSSKRAQDLFDEKLNREIKLRNKCKDLEAIFLTQLFKVMEKTIPKSENEDSKNTLASMMFSSVMGQTLANQGGIGLTDMIYESVKDKEGIPEFDELKTNEFIDNVSLFKLLGSSENE